MKRYDALIIIAILLIGFSALAVNHIGGSKATTGMKVEIYVEGRLYRTVLLSKDIQQVDIKTPRGSNTLTIYPDGVKMTHANCTSQTCVHTLKQTISGGVIACLPNKVLVKLVGNSQGEVDAIAN